jgi:diguanylate cyclase (GGDEF)-like protein
MANPIGTGSLGRDAAPVWPADSPAAPVYEVTTLRGRVLSDERLAATSGPRITLVVGTLCVGLGLSVIWKGDASETAAGFWPPAGAALVALVALPVRRWGWVIGGILFPTMIGLGLGVMPVASGLWWALGNCAEPALAALVLKRFISSRRSTTPRLLLVFLSVAVVLAPMVGGALGAVGTVVGYGKPWFGVWGQWVLGDGLGVLVVAPFLLSVSSRRHVGRTRAELAALVTVVVSAAGLAFANIGANGAALLPYVILVGLIWSGMRFGTRSAAAAGFVVALAANIATSVGDGPFAASARSADIITLQIFLAIALITSFVVASMASDLADRDEVRRLLTHQATHDALTGLPNRILFTERLEEALTLGPGPRPSVAVLMIDLDDFKKINDRYGHPVGDLALRRAGELLRRALRPGDTLARLGGDEFVVLSEGLSGPEAAQAVAMDLRLGLALGSVAAESRYQLSASIGVALVDGDTSLTAADLLHRADIALYHTKRTRGACVSLFDDALQTHTRRRVEIAEELRGSIDRGEMSVVYQPVVSLASGMVSEFEALVRWNNRRLGPVGPDEFIPVAEDSGFISRLGDWVLDVACRQLASWREESPGVETGVAVNISARQLSDVSFPHRVRAILATALLPADALTLEITETAVMDDTEVSERVLEDLRVMGIRLSMDDFGTGYSSMSNLRRTPLNVLKIDRGFVAGLGNVAKDTAIVSSIIDLGHSFGLQVVAEGVETMSQLQHLTDLGCDHGQGFFWSPGVDASTAGSMLGSRFRVEDALVRR